MENLIAVIVLILLVGRRGGLYREIQKKRSEVHRLSGRRRMPQYPQDEKEKTQRSGHRKKDP